MRLRLADSHCTLLFLSLFVSTSHPTRLLPPFTTHSQSPSPSLLPRVRQGVIHQPAEIRGLSTLLGWKKKVMKSKQWVIVQAHACCFSPHNSLYPLSFPTLKCLHQRRLTHWLSCFHFCRTEVSASVRQPWYANKFDSHNSHRQDLQIPPSNQKCGTTVRHHCI